MSDSIDSTVPNTPLAFDEVTNIVNKDGAFASLRPCNEDARGAFDATINSIIKDMTDLEHFRQFCILTESCQKAGAFTQRTKMMEAVIVHSIVFGVEHLYSTWPFSRAMHQTGTWAQTRFL